MLNLDTHMIVHLLNGDLTQREAETILKEDLALCDISLWELAKLITLDRLVMDVDGPEFRRLMSVITVIPISLEIAVRSTRLDFSGDPADEIIAATSVVYGIPLLTRDKQIRKSKLVPLA